MQEMLPGLWTTGEIAERPQAEGKSDYHLMHEGGAPVVGANRDDMALVLDVGDRLVLLYRRFRIRLSCVPVRQGPSGVVL